MGCDDDVSAFCEYMNALVHLHQNRYLNTEVMIDVNDGENISAKSFRFKNLMMTINDKFLLLTFFQLIVTFEFFISSISYHREEGSI